MANFNGTIYANSQVPGTASPANWQTAGYINGRVKVQLDFYVGAGEAIGSVLYMGAPLPAGAKVLNVQVMSSANTTSLTFSVGDLNSATRYASADSGIATKGITMYSGCIDSTNGFYVIGTNPGTGANAALTGDAQIIITIGGAVLGTGTIYGLKVEYVTD